MIITVPNIGLIHISHDHIPDGAKVVNPELAALESTYLQLLDKLIFAPSTTWTALVPGSTIYEQRQVALGLAPSPLKVGEEVGLLFGAFIFNPHFSPDDAVALNAVLLREPASTNGNCYGVNLGFIPYPNKNPQFAPIDTNHLVEHQADDATIKLLEKEKTWRGQVSVLGFSFTHPREPLAEPAAVAVVVDPMPDVSLNILRYALVATLHHVDAVATSIFTR